MASEKIGSGRRFKGLERRLAAKGAKNPAALAAWIGRKDYGKRRFQQLAEAGRRRQDGPARAGRGEHRTRV